MESFIWQGLAMKIARPPTLLLAARHGLLDLLLPPQCQCCDARVAAQGLLCAECFCHIDFITEPYCTCCGVPFATTAQADGHGLCPTCGASPPLFHRARAALRYTRLGRQLILPLKHADRIELAAMLAAPMARAGSQLLRSADVLLPVPLHRRRLFLRRYNQAALLAKAIGRIAGIATVLDGLVRKQATPPLGDKSAAERAETVRGAFAVRPGRSTRLTGRSVVLVDDVMTSGATANACAAVLLDAGVAQVDVLVAARVPDPRLH